MLARTQRSLAGSRKVRRNQEMPQLMSDREAPPLARSIRGNQNGSGRFVLVGDQGRFEAFGVELTDACDVEVSAELFNGHRQRKGRLDLKNSGNERCRRAGPVQI